MSVGFINRRKFLSETTAVALGVAVTPLAAAPAQPEVAFTFDDPRASTIGNMPWQDINSRMLAALANHRIKSVLFVCGMRVDSTAGQDLITHWDREGHLIGNHSYSHFNLDRTELSVFEADALRVEPIISSYRHFTKLFRYPQFKEGNTVEKRDGMRAFLQKHDYGIGRATIDASDWAISARLEKRLVETPKADLAPYRAFFLQHIWDRALFYQSLAQRIVARPVRHTILLHHNPLNALFLDDLISMFVANGWRPVSAEYAYRDPIYRQQPNILPAGESLVWALAKETGKFESELRYPGEDDTYENPKMDALNL